MARRHAQAGDLLDMPGERQLQLRCRQVPDLLGTCVRYVSDACIMRVALSIKNLVATSPSYCRIASYALLVWVSEGTI